VRLHPLLAPIFALPIALAGCVNTDAAVFVEPTIESPTATVDSNPLGTQISGSFTLKLHLGPRASGPSQVTLGAFSILDSARSAAITAVQLATTSTQFPATVDLDSDVSASLLFNLGSKTLPEDPNKGKLCDPAGVVIGGIIEDSLLGDSTPFFSSIVHPAGCM
jgi:hypothetical protein